MIAFEEDSAYFGLNIVLHDCLMKQAARDSRLRVTTALIPKIANIVLALMLLVSTGGIMVNKHYCQEKLVGVSVFSGAKTCCDDPAAMPNHCCHDEVEWMQLNDDFSGKSFRIAAPAFALYALPPLVTDPEMPDGLQTQPEFLNHRPPILHPDRYIWVASFLI